MRKFFPCLCAVLLALFVSDCERRQQSTASDEFDSESLARSAEDLWGQTINLTAHQSGLTLMHPFSPSNCGYCLFDEQFTDVNYRENTESRGGAYFGVCLFNPQLDIYSFEKHYRSASPIITSPMAFHGYHENGYPWMIAFKDGKRIYSGGVAPYEKVFKDHREEFWGEEIPLLPTSNLQLLTRLVRENNAGLGLDVWPDGAELPSEENSRDYTAIHESDLTDEALEKNLFFRGRTEEFTLEALEGANIPVEITSETVGIGGYNFPKADVCLVAGFPNPFNPERCLILQLTGSNLKKGTYQNWVDYTICGNDSEGNVKVLMNGLFENSEDGWKYSEELAWVSEEALSFCLGACPAPPGMRPLEEKADFQTPPVKREPADKGELWTLGSSNCRFPSLAVDGTGNCWVVWEENGDIVLAELTGGGGSTVLAIEKDVSDSFNPALALDDLKIWVFYLNDRDGFYRLYGRYGDKAGLDSEMMLSGWGAMDAITPAAASNENGKILVAWSEWKANQRYLMYRAIEGRMLGDTHAAAIKTSDIDYTNAWTPSLALDNSGNVWGAWNQHYPLTLGVYSGNLTEEAMPVIDEKGGYPSTVFDAKGRPWVFWESYMADVRYNGAPQKINAAYYDSARGRWSLPYNLSAGGSCLLNQTPKAAVDEGGVIWVTWSGRMDEGSPWEVYICRSLEEGWSEPELVSLQGEVSRAPAIAAGDDGEVWVAWHSGTGQEMEIRVLRYKPEH